MAIVGGSSGVGGSPRERDLAGGGPDGTVVTGGNNKWIQTFSSSGRPGRRYDRELESYSSPIVTDSGIAFQGNHHAAVVAVDLKG